MLNKIKGGLFGVAVGDALGCTTEFMTPKEIQETFGMVDTIRGGGPFFFLKGEVTDDTDMTLCVAKGILESPEDPIEAIGHHFLTWKNSHPKDMGNTVATALNQYKGNWEVASRQTNILLGGKTAGNGSLMRTLPVALAYKNPFKIMMLSHKQSKMTHWDEKANEACILYNRIAHRLLLGEELKKAIEEEVEGTAYRIAILAEPNEVPNAYVINTLRWALYLVYTSHSFKEVIVRAANMGYDSDTTAAIAGGLAGIYYGFDGIPAEYVDELLIKEELNEIAEKITQFRHTQA